MTTDFSFDWHAVRRVTGHCIRPGGAALTARAIEICNLTPDSRIVDVGCGPGGTLEYLERTGIHRPVGLDCSETLLGEAGSRLLSTPLVHGCAETLPFKTEHLDALFCECVLSVLGDRAKALREFGRVLEGGGFLILSDIFIHAGSGYRPLGDKQQGLALRGLPTRESLTGFLTEIGFSVVLWEEHERLLKEFAALMILAGANLSDLWKCGQSRQGKAEDHAGISYFLLVARKQGSASGFPGYKGGKT